METSADDEVKAIFEGHVRFIESWFGVTVGFHQMDTGDIIVLGIPFHEKGVVFACLLEAATHLAGAVEVLKSIENSPNIFLTRLHAAQF